MVPAPRNPIPLTTWAAMRDGSNPTCSLLSTSANPQNETIINRAEPTHTSICVRSPATQFSRSRSMPTILPNTAATTNRRIIWCSGSMCVSPRYCIVDSSTFKNLIRWHIITTSVMNYPHRSPADFSANSPPSPHWRRAYIRHASSDKPPTATHYKCAPEHKGEWCDSNLRTVSPSHGSQDKGCETL